MRFILKILAVVVVLMPCLAVNLLIASFNPNGERFSLVNFGVGGWMALLVSLALMYFVIRMSVDYLIGLIIGLAGTKRCPDLSPVRLCRWTLDWIPAALLVAAVMPGLEIVNPVAGAALVVTMAICFAFADIASAAVDRYLDGRNKQ